MGSWYIKSFNCRIKKGGSSSNGSCRCAIDSIFWEDPRSRFEAEQQCIKYINKKHPGWEIVDLQINFKRFIYMAAFDEMSNALF